MKLNSDFYYFLGLSYSDGCVSNKINGKYYTFQICLKDSDVQILNDLCNKLNMGKVVYKKSIYNNLSYRVACFQICDVVFIKDLINRGINPNKTYENTSVVFDNVPNKYKIDFIRGYFDGDGSVGKYENKYRVSFVSLNYKLLDRIRLFLNKKIESSVNIITDGKYFRLSYSGNGKVLSFKELIYFEKDLFLKRKFDIISNVRNLGAVSGEKSTKSKLKIKEVKYIKNSDKSYNKLAELFNVSKGCVQAIKQGITWRNI